jgi:hypothetical protein
VPIKLRRREYFLKAGDILFFAKLWLVN